MPTLKEYNVEINGKLEWTGIFAANTSAALSAALSWVDGPCMVSVVNVATGIRHTQLKA